MIARISTMNAITIANTMICCIAGIIASSGDRTLTARVAETAKRSAI